MIHRPIFFMLLYLFFLLLFSSCSSIKTSNILYDSNIDTTKKGYHKLDIYQPKKSEDLPVVIFVHGGYWDEGSKDLYGFLGRNFAKKDVVSVIVNYTLSPDGNYDTMAIDIVNAINWVNENINQYGGDPEDIYLMGHSAGGHLIALVSTHDRYKESGNLVKGVILDDAAGLDMYSYLKENPPTSDHHYIDTWTKDENLWKEASPIYYLSDNSPPFLIYVGKKSYQSIITSNKKFVNVLNEYQSNVEILYQNKTHVGMIRQFVFPWNGNYRRIIEFIEDE